MKHLLTSVLLGVAAVSLSWALPDGSQRVRKVATIEGDGTTIYGEVTHSNSMDVLSPEGLTWGLYSFNASNPMTVTPVTIHNTLCANGGGTYRKGKLYFTSYYEDMGGNLGYLYFVELNLADNSIERHALVPDTYDAIAADMTYDPIGDKIYGVSFDRSDYNLSTYVLVDFDLATGYPNVIASIPRMSAIASDNMGQLWGVRYSDGQLVKIDKLNANVTEVGPTGVNPIYNGSACFDFETGKLYWATNERTTEESALYQIDINTGAASMISKFPDGESMAALYIPRQDNITLLEPVSNVTASFEGSSTEGTISFTAPSKTKDGRTITGDVTVAGYLDGNLSFSIPMEPGASTTRNYTLAQGPHKIELIATHPSEGKSDLTSLNFYVGSDGPAAVGNLKLTKATDSSITLTWDTPQKGEHGGTINPNLIYYRITRMPDGKVITDEATGNSYTDKITEPSLRRYSYEVTGFYKNVEGATAVSEEMELGAPLALPYLQTFDTMAGYMTYVVRDNNKDPEAPNEGIWGWYQPKKCAMYSYHTLLPGDDWLITPGFELKAGRTYRLSFKSQGGRLYAETLEVKIGKGYNAEDFTQTLMKRTDILSPDEKMKERVITFDVPENGNYYIGFHAVSTKGMYYLWLDDIGLEEGPSMAAPGLAENFKAVPGENADETIISFNAPAQDIFGNELDELDNLKLYRDETLVKTFDAADGIAVGKAMNWTDTAVPAGSHTYKIIGSNENGEGNPAETTVYAGLDIPVIVTDAVHTTSDGVNATISWTAPTVGTNGGSLAYEPLKYRITDRQGNTVADAVEGTSFTTKVDTSTGQNSQFYTVAAYNSVGSGEGLSTDFITYGDAYSDSFAESFAGGKKPTTSDWIMRVINPSPYDNGFYGRYFSFKHNPNDKDRGPKPAAQDGDDGMLVAYTDFLDVEARMISPKINVKGLKNPVLSFWFYHYYNPNTETGYSTEKETMTVEAYVDGEYKALTAAPILLINGNGWYRYDLPLKEAVGAKDFQVAFHTHNYISYDMHIDNITVHDVPDNDLQASGFTLTDKIAVNSTRNAVVTVFNNGMTPADNFTVELYRDGDLVAEQDGGEPLAFAKERTYTFPITPSIVDAGKDFNYQAKINFAADADMSNNDTETIKVSVPVNTLPRVSGLKGSVNNGIVSLTWDEPDMNSGGIVTDGFEAYEPFTISNFGEWTLVDNDGSLTYTISNSQTESGDYEYPNAGYQMAFQALNPGKAGIKGNLWTPYLGEQMAVCFAAAERSNDDWLISPEVKGGSTVTFMAKTVVADYGLDQFRFCYSPGEEMTLDEFKQIGATVTVPASGWTKYEFTLPADARYFAINCVSDNTYALLIDEVTYESANPDMLEFRGYNIYRDGERINGETVEENEYIDNDPKAEGKHLYHVSAVYDKGESGLSEGWNSDLTGIGTLTADGMSVKTGNGSIAIMNAGGRKVSICTLNGIVVFNEKVGEYAIISLEPGIYMLRSDDRTLKLIVK